MDDLLLLIKNKTILTAEKFLSCYKELEDYPLQDFIQEFLVAQSGVGQPQLLSGLVDDLQVLLRGPYYNLLTEIEEGTTRKSEESFDELGVSVVGLHESRGALDTVASKEKMEFFEIITRLSYGPKALYSPSWTIPEKDKGIGSFTSVRKRSSSWKLKFIFRSSRTGRSNNN